MNKIITVDPGASGGFAWTDEDRVAHCYPMPETEGDVLTLLRELHASIGPNNTTVFVEDQVGCVGPGMQVAATAMFKFGRGFGFILGALQAMGFRIELVRPQKWQKALSLGTKKDAGGKIPWKNKLKARAQRLYPACDVTLKTADALLILEYANNISAMTLLILLLMLSCVVGHAQSTNGISNGNTIIEDNGIQNIDGHKVKVSFRWEVVTNRWTHSARNGGSKYQPYEQWYAVDSNYVAVLVVDGKTNEVIQEGCGKQLGEVHRTYDTVVSTVMTNEIFEPQQR